MLGAAQQSSSASPVCSHCRGHRITASPDGGRWQKCALCEGTGIEYDPGRFFCYELGPIVVGALATVKGQSVQIIDGAFRWREIAGVSTSTNYTLQIYRGRDNRPFMQQPIHSTEFVGTGTNPFPLLTPFEFLSREYILVNFTDLSGAQNTIRLLFIGEQLQQNKS